MGTAVTFVELASCEHNDEFECFECSEERHQALHPEPDDECLSCRLRSVQISPAATPSKRNPNNPPTWHEGRTTWEKGIATDSRNMPLLDAGLNPVPIKRYSENRHYIEEQRRRLHQDPHVFTTKE